MESISDLTADSRQTNFRWNLGIVRLLSLTLPSKVLKL